ncbi:hypothetical protein BDV32DRAFT_117803 [Aspergillus pseudonomiae]|nr:hypothetical protein BDV32DRAFT_117803 [Aspergillus pseudonomiae]
MIVPLFSGTHRGPRIDPKVVKQSAETVTQHAELFEALLAPYMYGQGDITLLPPFVGYGAFITGVVFLATEVSFQDKTPRRLVSGAHSESRRLSTVKGTLHLLNKLRFYWRAHLECSGKSSTLHFSYIYLATEHMNQPAHMLSELPNFTLQILNHNSPTMYQKALCTTSSQALAKHQYHR